MKRLVFLLCVLVMASCYALWSPALPRDGSHPEGISVSSTTNPYPDDLIGDTPAKLIQKPSKATPRRTDNGANYPNANQRMHYTVLQAFREAIGNNWMATVRVLGGGRMVALGTIVDRDGWIVTKASELPDEGIECRLSDGSRVPAKVVAKRSDVDLALVKIEKSGLQPVEWAADSDLQVGTWLASTDLKSIPVAIGVVSVQTRSIKSERAVMGVGFDWTPKGNLVNMVLPGSGAARAGVIVGDIIVSVDKNKLRSRQDLVDRIARFKAGQTIVLDVIRDDENVDIQVELMDLNHSLLDPTEMEVNGEVSSRSSGFSSVFQHDTVISPSQCGGPLVDLNGKAVGINIARAGRVASYGLPASLVKKVASEMMVAAKNSLPSRDNLIMRSQDSPLTPLAK